MAAKISELIEDLKGINRSHKVKVRYKKEYKGLSFYLDYWDKDTQTRRYKFLDLIIKDPDKNTKEDQETWKSILKERQEEENRGTEALKKEQERSKLFFSYINEKMLQCRAKNSQSAFRSMLLHFKEYHPRDIKLEHIDHEIIEGFQNYLLNSCLKKTSTKQYMTVLKIAINDLLKNDVLINNPVKRLKQIGKTEFGEREYLTEEELNLVYVSDGILPEIKNAFIFSCYTGLRSCDLKAIKFDQVKNGNLFFTQVKTSKNESLPLNKTALAIIEQQKNKPDRIDDYIFHLPTHASVMLSKWIKKIGIKKHITFHNGRHTAATMLLTNDVDIYTVSKILGHSSINTTAIYTKLIDKKKSEAINKLPDLQQDDDKKK